MCECLKNIQAQESFNMYNVDERKICTGFLKGTGAEFSKI